MTESTHTHTHIHSVGRIKLEYNHNLIKNITCVGKFLILFNYISNEKNMNEISLVETIFISFCIQLKL